MAKGTHARRGVTPAEPERAMAEVPPRQRPGDRLDGLSRVVTARDLEPDQRIAAMLTFAAESLGMDVALLGEFSDVLSVRHAHDGLGHFAPGTTLDLGDSLCKRVLDASESLFILDLRTECGTDGQPPKLAAYGVRGYVGLPIWMGDSLHAVLAFMSRAPLAAVPDARDTAFMELLAAWFGSQLYEQAQRELLEHMALTDPLTNLQNRRAAERRLLEELARARRYDEGFAVAMVDLDHFAAVNERYGRNVGDQVLKGVARILESGLRNEDWLARWSGEKFLLFMRRASARDAIFILERIAQTLRTTPLTTAAGDIRMTLSAGIGLPEKSEVGLAALLAEAEMGLQTAKAGGRDRVEARGSHGGIPWMAQEVRHARRDRRIRMATQVIVDLVTRQAVADEALAWVRTADGRALPAGEFIATAEGLGLMAEIDSEMLGKAMARMSRNRAQGTLPEGFAHFVNLSPQFLDRRDLVSKTLDIVRAHCETCGIDKAAVKPIVFEITERQFLTNLNSLEDELRPLLDYGFRLALDDFGSGYSSFLYLARLPVSFLKIEGWMVANMARERKIANIVETLAEFANREGIVTIAECVENEATAVRLRDMGIRWGQGWHFGRPRLEGGELEGNE